MRVSRLALILFGLMARFPAAAADPWTQTNGPRSTCISAIVADGPSLYVHSLAGIFVSSDEGDSWNKIGTVPGSCSQPYGFAARHDTLYAQGDSGMQIRYGTGVPWKYPKLSPYGQGPYAYMTSVAVDSASVWIGTSEQGVYRSTNHGATWTRVETGMLHLYDQRYLPARIALNGGNVYLASETGMFRSADQGQTWIPCGRIPGADSLVIRIAFMSRYLFAMTGTGVYRSADSGSHWTTLDLGAAVDPATYDFFNSLDTAGSRLYVTADNEGLFVSEDAGDHWARIPDYSSPDNIRLTQQVAGLGQYLFAATDLGVYRSSDQGHTWTGMHKGMAFGAVYRLVGNGPGRILAGEAGGIFSTEDTGGHWTRIPFRPKLPTALFRFGNAILASESNDGLYRSLNDGLGWNRVTTSIAVSDSAQGEERLFGVGTELFYWTARSGLSISDDSGKTWRPAPGWNRGAPGTMTRFGGRDYALSDDTLLRFEADRGDWEPRAELSGMLSGFDLLGAKGPVLLRGGIHGLFGSPDSGATWARLLDSAATGNVYCFLSNGEEVYAGTDSGVAVSRIGNPAWTIVNSGLPADHFLFPYLNGGRSAVSLLVQDGYLFAGFQRAGIWKIPLDQISSAVTPRASRRARPLPAKWSFVAGGIGFLPNPGKTLRDAAGRSLPGVPLRR